MFVNIPYLEKDMAWLFCLAVGTFAGLVAGMTGAGTYFLLVPGLSFALALSGIGGPDPLKMAIATAQGALLVTAFAAFQAHAVRRSIAWGELPRLLCGAIAGGVGGALIGMELDRAVTACIFIVLTLTVAVPFFRKPRHLIRAQQGKPSFAAATLWVVLFGGLAAITGAGGLLSPFLRSFLPAEKVVGSSAATTLVIVIAAVTTSYTLSTTPPLCRTDCYGAMFLPGVFAAGLAAVLAAPFGAWISHSVPGTVIRKGFAILLVVFAAAYLPKMAPTVTAAAFASVALLDGAAGSNIEPAAPPGWLSERSR
jgi:uncharacterized membrane protein YfcA